VPMYSHVVLKQAVNFTQAKDVVVRGAGHAVRSIVVRIMTLSQDSVYKGQRITTIPSAAKRRRDSRKRTTVEVGTLGIVPRGGRRSNLW
jgi:bisphosphoglycerate-dependent phosphoglycerate mutase